MAVGKNLQEGFVESNGIRMHYAFKGRGEPIIFLHGFPEHWYSWRYQLDGLAAAGFTALAPDLRGYGQSERPESGYDSDTLVADVIGFAEGLGFKQFNLVGHDWGGPLAWLTAMSTPAVKKLAIVNGPHPGIFARNLLTTSQLLRSFYMFIFQVPGLAERLLQRNDYQLVKLMFKDGQKRAPEKISDQDIERLTEAVRQPGTLKAGLSYYRQAFRRNPLKQYRELKKVEVPTCVIWGTSDRALVPDSKAKLARWVDAPFELHYLEGTGHWAPQEKPDEINRILSNFFATK